VLDPASLQLANSASAGKEIAARPLLFATLVGATMLGMLWLAATALSAGGFGLMDAALVLCFAFTLPWMVIGFWNSVIGFLIMRFAADPAAVVTPVAGRVRGDEPIIAATAILLCIRNEVPGRIVQSLQPMLRGLAESEAAERFHLFVLSDSSDAAVAAEEEKQFAELATQWRGRIGITYRRRTLNTGFKAGNIREFCDRWGTDYELAVTLDADSIMPAGGILRMVRIMQAEPSLGILQGLVVGLPSTSAFARIFQFGMRLGMRSYTLGATWWQGDSGPYWGHNAILRLRPFIAHCRIPPLRADGGAEHHILSHDQIEAALMRRAGYGVRVLCREDLGWEENPKALLEFIRRDLRWCEGNMQYWPFLTLPGLPPVGRYHIAFAILMFLGSPAWMGVLVLGTLALAFTAAPAEFIRPGAGLALFAILVVMWFSPKLATAADVLTRRGASKAFGGTPLFVANCIMEMVFFTLLCPIMWFGHTMFMAALPFGRGIGWIGQTRDDHVVPLPDAARDLWPHTLLGAGTLAVLAATHPAAIPYALFLAAGPALSIPLAVATSIPAVGRAFARWGIGRLPEETAPSPILEALDLPALAEARPKRAAP
jgi:membrane glycosyltransferase